MFRFILLILAVLLEAGCISQRGITKSSFSIKNVGNEVVGGTYVFGHVVSALGEIPIQHAYVSVDHMEIWTLTDSTGSFKLLLPEGAHKVIVNATGYTTVYTDSISLVNDEDLKLIANLGTTTIY